MSTSPLLSIEDLRVRYRVDPAVPALDGVDLTVGEGEVVAVVGESGSGKSTMARTVLGLTLPAAHVSGRIAFQGRDLLPLDARRWREVRGRGIGLIAQDPLAALNPVMRVGDQVAEALLAQRLVDRRGVRRKVVEALAAAGLDDPEPLARRYPHELSGGMRQRVLIGLMIALRPRLIVADEPTSALDVTVQRVILDQITALNAGGTGVLLITHDLAVAAERAHRVVVLRHGRMVETGPAAQVLDRPAAAYTRELVTALPGLTSARKVRAPARTDAPMPLLCVRDLTKVYGRKQRATRAVDGVSFDVHAGETVAVVGESGSGKTTTARMVLRLAAPTAGRILFQGADITTLGGRDLRRTRRHIQLVHQDPASTLDPRFTVERCVAEPLKVFTSGTAAERRRTVARLLDEVALGPELLRRRSTELSGGQRQRVAIARALACRPDLLVCDEPVSALDVSVQSQILDLLVRLQQELSLSYLFISHDLAVVRQIAHRVVVMRHGRVVETGTTEQIFDAPRHDYTKALLAAIPGRPAHAAAP
ncbi:ABC transporter ATP-binding protein [Phytohabitans sp. ZYX-F-186]|uniref:ABC transporter ATP-binding protein n=1 Tax=Phytohabitans maris TaxID=3071409 RepID=A0ABU0ZDK1_9ACTN|nr:ABC transporter ATP-binding protein [Phytohabitans sp. ZYX-F-186]MDQ7905127.1 ABC transporter ATP-binding protein [Phytohabitans sp. ZYX-F-186]